MKKEEQSYKIKINKYVMHTGHCVRTEDYSQKCSCLQQAAFTHWFLSLIKHATVFAAGRRQPLTPWSKFIILFRNQRFLVFFYRKPLNKNAPLSFLKKTLENLYIRRICLKKLLG